MRIKLPEIFKKNNSRMSADETTDFSAMQMYEYRTEQYETDEAAVIDGDKIFYFRTLEEAVQLVYNCNTIKLLRDTYINIIVEKDKILNIDLNGKTILNKDDTCAFIKVEGRLNLYNGKVKTRNVCAIYGAGGSKGIYINNVDLVIEQARRFSIETWCFVNICNSSVHIYSDIDKSDYCDAEICIQSDSVIYDTDVEVNSKVGAFYYDGYGNVYENKLILVNVRSNNRVIFSQDVKMFINKCRFVVATVKDGQVLICTLGNRECVVRDSVVTEKNINHAGMVDGICMHKGLIENCIVNTSGSSVLVVRNYNKINQKGKIVIKNGMYTSGSDKVFCDGNGCYGIIKAIDCKVNKTNEAKV